MHSSHHHRSWDTTENMEFHELYKKNAEAWQGWGCLEGRRTRQRCQGHVGERDHMAEKDVWGSRGGKQMGGGAEMQTEGAACLGLSCRKGDSSAGEVVWETVLPSLLGLVDRGVVPLRETKHILNAIRQGKYQTLYPYKWPLKPLSNFLSSDTQRGFMHTRFRKHHSSFWTVCGKNNAREVCVQPQDTSLLLHTLITGTAHPAFICLGSIAFKAIRAALASAPRAPYQQEHLCGQSWSLSIIVWWEALACGGCSSSIRTEQVLTQHRTFPTHSIWLARGHACNPQQKLNYINFNSWHG